MWKIYVDAADTSRSISAKQARLIVRKIVAGLRALGVRPDRRDVICLNASNDIMFPVFSLGIIAAGAIFAATNPAYTAHELTHHFRISETKYIITEPEALQPVISAAEACNVPRSNIFIFDVLGQATPEGFSSFRSLFSHGEEGWHGFDDLETAKATEACRLFSSGTTGPPKATRLTHHNFVAQHEITRNRDERDHQVRRLIVLPMFHMAAVPTALITALKEGHLSFVMRRFTLEGFLANIERFGITEVGMVPPLVIATIMSPLSKKYSLKSLRNATCGAAPLGKGPQEQFQNLMSDGEPFTQVYGMTEATCAVTKIQSPEHDTTGSVGRLLPNLDVKLLDHEGRDTCDLSKPGELLVRGPTIIPGYVNHVGENPFDKEGFYHSGDIMYCDKKTGLWYLVDRKKELIKVKAFQVAPPELESVLLGHPLIVDAAVIGVHDLATKGPEVIDEGGGQLPRAYIVRRPDGKGTSLTEAEVYDWVKAKLVRYKWLDGGVQFIDAIPKTASGKILKQQLRKRAAKERLAKL